jgi:dipeptidyl-peptidase-4
MNKARVAALGFLALMALVGPAEAQAPAPAALESFADSQAEVGRILDSEVRAIRGGKGDPVFVADGKFLLMDDAPNDLTVVEIVGLSGARRTLLTGAAVESAWNALQGATFDPAAIRVAGLSDNGAEVLFTQDGRTVAVPISGGPARFAPEIDRRNQLHNAQVTDKQFPTTFGDLSEAAAPDGSRFITLVDRDLWVRSAKDGTLRRLTSDGAERFGWRNTEESAEGLNVQWAPDGRRISAVKLDERKVSFEPMVRWLEPTPRVQPWPYPRAGQPIAAYEVYVIDADSGQRVRLDIGDTSDKYVNLAGWRADGGAVFYEVFDREQKRLDLRAADPATGASKTILTLTSPTYLDTPMTLGPILVTPLTKSNDILVFQDEGGMRQLFRYSADGRRLARLTDGKLLAHEIVVVDEARGFALLKASTNPARPYDVQLIRVGLNGGKVAVLTPESGAHKTWLAPSGDYVVDRVSTVNSPPVTRLRTVAGKQVSEVSRADVSGLKALGFVGAEPFVTRSADGRFDVHGVVIKPFGFDPAKRYPVIEMVYGGMQVSHIPKTFYGGGDLVSGYNVIPGRVLLHHGYVVVYVDAPGTPMRGRAFQDATYGIWPQTAISNHTKWIRDAAAAGRPWMDLGRVGIYGNSWGGYMTERALIDAPDLYKVGVSTSAPADFVDHPPYIELFMGLPSNNPAGYAAGSNLARVGEIEGKLLLMSFPLDVNAGFSPMIRFADAMAKAHKEVDLFTLPDVNHRINCCGVEREHYGYAVITRYFRRWLGEGPE